MSDIINYLARLVRNFGWKDGLELALIGGIIYLVYRSLRGTRGARLVRGFVFLLLIVFVGMWLVSESLHMERLQFLYGKLLLALAVLALIVFQPELRRSLMRLGQNPLLRLFLKEGASAFMDRIVRAAATLSRNKVGAIIAIERDARLGGLIESGVRLDAQLTHDLLTTIFWPGSPLHDMGVVIRGGRIAAAGCEFPLSRHAILDPHLGTRHRAAVGLTEESDAIVIIISEETGQIALAEGGRLQQDLTPEELRKRLKEFLHGAEATLTEHSLETPEPTPDEKESSKQTDTESL